MRMGRNGRAGSPLPAESASGTSAVAHGGTRPTTSSFERGEKYARVPNKMRRINGGCLFVDDFRKANRPPLALIK